MNTEDVEALVSYPIESSLSGASGIRRIRSTSTDGLSIVWAEFDSSASSVNASNAAHACTDFILNGISYDKIAKKYDVPEQSIRELVTVVADQYHFSSVFKVQVRSMDMDLSKRIMETILLSSAICSESAETRWKYGPPIGKTVPSALSFSAMKSTASAR